MNVKGERQEKEKGKDVRRIADKTRKKRYKVIDTRERIGMQRERERMWREREREGGNKEIDCARERSD